MELRSAMKGQYRAALAMLRETIELCPDEVWTSGTPPRLFWRVAYHALFYTDLYLQPNLDSFQPWEKHGEGYEDQGADFPLITAFTKAELLGYLDAIDARIDATVDRLDLDSPECGFWWYDMPKLDHQLMNIRHIQQHAGQLSELLMVSGIDTDWIGRR